MTRFWRSGHTRTDSNGFEYEVKGHWVERDDWDRYAEIIARYQTVRPSTVAPQRPAYRVNPNARCPVCGGGVFYYENEHGSRVFFDHLGPDWPKHPCMDDAEPDAVRTRLAATPVTRTSGLPLVAQADNGISSSGPRPDNGWRLFQVMRTSARGELIEVRARTLDLDDPTYVRFLIHPVDDFPARGGIVFLKADRVAYFSLTLFEPVDRQIISAGKRSKAGSRRRRALEKKKARRRNC